MDFVAIDLETANARMASICQVGIATFQSGELADQWVSLVDPEDYFDPFNTMIHGITEDDVRGMPTFPQIIEIVRDRLDGQIAVCHTHFDRVAIGQAVARYGLVGPRATWLDSARVTRRAWPEFARSGYGLASACAHIGYPYEAHDALEDAKAAGMVILAAIEVSGLPLEGWLRRVEQSIWGETSSHVTRDGNPDGPLYGTSIVFTGALEVPRGEAANLASQLGCTVADNVSRKTDFLVVGEQDLSRLAGHEKSTKHRKAEGLRAEGHPIRIIGERDFLELVATFSIPAQAESV